MLLCSSPQNTLISYVPTAATTDSRPWIYHSAEMVTKPVVLLIAMLQSSSSWDTGDRERHNNVLWPYPIHTIIHTQCTNTYFSRSLTLQLDADYLLISRLITPYAFWLVFGGSGKAWICINTLQRRYIIRWSKLTTCNAICVNLLISEIYDMFMELI